MEEYEETSDEEGRHFKVKVGNTEVGILDYDGLYYFEFTNDGSRDERVNAIDKCDEVYNFENYWNKMIYLKVIDEKGEVDISDLTFEGLNQIKFEAEELIKDLEERISKEEAEDLKDNSKDNNESPYGHD